MSWCQGEGEGGGGGSGGSHTHTQTETEESVEEEERAEDGRRRWGQVWDESSTSLPGLRNFRARCDSQLGVHSAPDLQLSNRPAGTEPQDPSLSLLSPS